MQEMNYQEGYRDEQPATPAYEGLPPPMYNTRSYGPAGQKLTGFARSNVSGASAGQRLALAIVSLMLWIGMFVFVTIGVVSTISSGLGSGSKFLISLMLVFGMLVFSGIVIFLNILFHRGRQ